MIHLKNDGICLSCSYSSWHVKSLRFSAIETTPFLNVSCTVYTHDLSYTLDVVSAKNCITAWLLTVSFFFHKIKTQPDGTRIPFLSFTLAFHFVPFNKCLISIKISQSNFVEIKHSSFLKAQKIHKIYNWSSQSQLTITLMIGFFLYGNRWYCFVLYFKLIVMALCRFFFIDCLNN